MPVMHSGWGPCGTLWVPRPLWRVATGLGPHSVLPPAALATPCGWAAGKTMWMLPKNLTNIGIYLANKGGSYETAKIFRTNTCGSLTIFEKLNGSFLPNKQDEQRNLGIQAIMWLQAMQIELCPAEWKLASIQTFKNLVRMLQDGVTSGCVHKQENKGPSRCVFKHIGWVKI